MASTCPDCGRAFTRDRKAVESITGRRICEDCDGGIMAAAAGVIANPTMPVEGAIATQGWWQRRRARRREG